MGSLLILLASAALAAPGFTAATLDGREVTGELSQIDRQKTVLRTAEGPVEITTAELLSLQPNQGAKSPEKQPPISVRLADGSILRSSSYEVGGDTAQVETGAADAIKLPAKQVRAVQLTELDAEAARRFEELLVSNAAADVIAVRKKESTATSFLEGIVGDVTADMVQFTLDGEQIPVKRDRIQGIIYYRGNQPDATTPLGVLHTLTGSRLALKDVRLDGENLMLVTSAGVELKQPLSNVSKIDFSAGKLQYLADLEPESFAWTPYIGLPELPQPLTAFYGLRRDRGWQSGPLQLGGKTFTRGIALASRSEVVYRLPAGSRRFQALLGIDDAVQDRGHVVVQIFADDKQLHSGPVTGADQPLPLDLDVAGARRLRIVVDYGAHGDVADHLNLCEARISR